MPFVFTDLSTPNTPPIFSEKVAAFFRKVFAIVSSGSASASIAFAALSRLRYAANLYTSNPPPLFKPFVFDRIYGTDSASDFALSLAASAAFFPASCNTCSAAAL